MIGMSITGLLCSSMLIIGYVIAAPVPYAKIKDRKDKTFGDEEDRSANELEGVDVDVSKNIRCHFPEYLLSCVAKYSKKHCRLFFNLR